MGLALTLGLVFAAAAVRIFSPSTDRGVPSVTARDLELLEVGRMALPVDPAQIDRVGFVSLRWQGAAHCTWVYGIRVDEEHHDESVTRLLNRQPERALHHLALGEAERGDAEPGLHILDARFESADGQVHRAGDTTQIPVSLRRTVAIGPAIVGPAAPDAACRSRAWDHVEDALALGWPMLPDARVRAGATWPGAQVGARCNQTACLDTWGGLEPGTQSCVVGPWREQLVGVLPFGEGRAALVRSDWDDGNPNGVSSSRWALISDEGRLLRASVVVEHPYEGVTRHVDIEAIDDCASHEPRPGFGDRARVQQMRAALVQRDETRRIARP